MNGSNFNSLPNSTQTALPNASQSMKSTMPISMLRWTRKPLSCTVEGSAHLSVSKPKAPQLQEESQLSPNTLEYLHRLRNIKEEFEVLDLIEPQYEYPVTAQVFTPAVYLKANGAPYDFRKRISKATKHSCIDITHCPLETLASLLDTFPASDISFTRTNLLIPYIPTIKAIARAYKVLPVDTIIEYEKLPYLQYRDQSDTSDSTTDSMAEHQSNHESPLNVPGPLPSIEVQPPTPQTNFNNALPGIQGLNLGTQIDPTIVAAVIATLQMAGIGAQAQPKATKMKIKEPEKYNGKNRGGDAEQFILSCKNYFRAWPSNFPDDEAQIQFTPSYLTGTAQAWGDIILRDILGLGRLNESS
ncbi:hypothetical protein FS837_002554, partial [Tulasnella sp. UAMH 9824]